MSIDLAPARGRGLAMAAALSALLVVTGMPGRIAAAEVASPPTAARVLDDFADMAPWHAGRSDGVDASLAAVKGPSGPALRLDFDLHGTAGYALAARALPLQLPTNFELAFDLRGDAPTNDFQVKLVDESGENVWWFRRRDFDFSAAWRHVTIKRRQIEFAWGPTSDHVLRSAARIEFVVAAGRGGGAGNISVGHLVLRELPPEPTSWPAPQGAASSALPGAAPALAVDGARTTAWQSDPAQGSEQWIALDFGRAREFGGLVLRWRDGAYASRYDVEFSDDGNHWKTVRSVIDARGGPDALLLTDSETRHVRLALHDGPAHAYALAEIEVRDLAFGASPNAFFEAVAGEFPRGYFPREFSGQQSYWTIVGVDGGGNTGLLSEDGALEIGQGGFSLEPFVRVGSEVVTWADADIDQSLRDGYLPIPSVTWRRPQWTLRVTTFASGTHAQSRLVARYELTNLTAGPLELELFVAARPLQVNPPTQFLSVPGGASSIRDIAWARGALKVNGEREVFALQEPAHVGLFRFDSGPAPRLLSTSGAADADQVHDPFGYASAALGFPLRLAPHASAALALAVPLSGSSTRPALAGRPPADWTRQEEDAVAGYWRERLNDVGLRVPQSAQRLADTLRTALAHILITRDGPVLRPGTRSYARSWIRDGAMMSESLLRLGRSDVAADYLRWYAPNQFQGGKIPCCVDARGADPVPENDSTGEFVFLAGEMYRYGQDRALLESMWPRVEAAMRYLEAQRQSGRATSTGTMTDASLHGLLPASISHEGYSQKPMHSYWDDFWGLKGYDRAIGIAAALGRAADARTFEGERDQFRRDIAASLLASAMAHRIDYLPGAAELGDFDPSSSSIAFAPAGDLAAIPERLIHPTFERYWREFRDRRDGHPTWEDYTPYELRNVGTFVRLGWRERANELLESFLADRRPPGWNQWAEVVGRDPRKPRFVGDMPHGWIASDFIRATLDLFAYERPGDEALVLAAGIKPSWLDGAGIGLTNLRTPFGRLTYTLRNDAGRVVLHVDDGLRIPNGGIVLTWPRADAPGATRVNGKAATWRNGELSILELPADVVVDQ